MTKTITNRKERSWKTYIIALTAVAAIGLLIYSNSTVSSATNANDQTFQKVVAANAAHGYSEVITSKGEVYARGLNNYGQLGNGTLTNATEWTKVNLDENVSKLSGSYDHTAALTKTGKVYTWGLNEYGITGNGSNGPAVKPTEVTASYRFSSISSGNNFVLALTENGHLFAWGDNTYGQLGTGDKTSRNVPTYVPTETTFTAVKAGKNYALALDSSGHIWAWGQNNAGQLGTSNTTDQTKPTKLNLADTYKFINTNLNSQTSVAISSNGYLYAWGDNSNGQVGNGSDWRAEQEAENQRVKDQIAAIQADDARRKQNLINQCIADKTAQWYEENSDEDTTEGDSADTSSSKKDGSKADTAVNATPAPTATPSPSGTPTPTQTPTPSDTPTPTQTPTPKPVAPDFTDDCTKQVNDSFKPTDTSGIKPRVIPEPALKANSLAPVLITSAVKFSVAAAGSQNTYAVDVLGRLYGWGSDSNGQSGIGVNEKTHTQVPVRIGTGSNFVSVDGGNTWGIALDSNGNVYTWGANTNNQLATSSKNPVTAPTQVAGNAAAVIAGDHTGYTIQQGDNKVASWGAGTDNLLGTGSTSDSAAPKSTGTALVSVSAGSASTVGLDSTGKLFYWGSNKNSTFGSSQNKDATANKPSTNTIDKFIDVAAGRDFTLAVDDSGNVWAWGYNFQKQTGPLSSGLSVSTPTLVPISGKTKLVAASESGAYAATDSDLYTWGNGNGEPSSQPLPDAPKELKAGSDSINVITESGKLFNAGKSFAAINEGEKDKLGEVEPGSTFVDVASSGETTFAVKKDGSVISWGSLALTFKEVSSKPIVTVPLDEKITSISVSPEHVVAVSKAGVPWAWGDEPNGTFGNVTTTITKATPIPVLTVGGNN